MQNKTIIAKYVINSKVSYYHPQLTTNLEFTPNHRYVLNRIKGKYEGVANSGVLRIFQEFILLAALDGLA